jgi:hypothetical protein
LQIAKTIYKFTNKQQQQHSTLQLNSTNMKLTWILAIFAVLFAVTLAETNEFTQTIGVTEGTAAFTYEYTNTGAAPNTDDQIPTDTSDETDMLTDTVIITDTDFETDTNFPTDTMETDTGFDETDTIATVVDTETAISTFETNEPLTVATEETVAVPSTTFQSGSSKIGFTSRYLALSFTVLAIMGLSL